MAGRKVDLVVGVQRTQSHVVVEKDERTDERAAADTSALLSDDFSVR